jgi:hypothetical protein
MRRPSGHSACKQVLALLLCYLLSPLSIYAVPQAGGGPAQLAGQITAVKPNATRNGAPTKLKDDIHWNDVVKTDGAGRVRIGLSDGSILSVGSNSELKVVQHDAASQQTQLELNYGKLRSRVVSITKPGGKFEVKTPNAVAGVVGTDWTIMYNPQTGMTSIVVYSGTIAVTGAGGQQVTVQAGQTVQISKDGKIGQPQNTPPDLQQESIADTTAEGGAGGGGAAGGSHFLRNLLIGLGVAVASVAIGVGTTGSKNTPAPTQTPTPTPTPPGGGG